MKILVGEKVNLYYTPEDTSNLTLTIYDTTRSLFFNGISWCEGKTSLFPKKNGDRYEYEFIPELEGEYVATYSNDLGDVYEYNITVFSSAENTPIKVTSETLKDGSGGTSEILDSLTGAPIAGAKISCFSLETKELIAVTQSGEDGRWSMYVPSNKEYIFIIQKDGYIGITLERLVV